MPTTNLSGVEISYDDLGGDEQALLVLTGWCDDRVQLQPLARELAAGGRRVLVMDWRGHGASGTPDADFGQEELVRDALAVIRASGARRVVPVAESHAGWIAAELRERLGESVPRLVLLDWIVTEPPAPFLEALRALQTERWREVRSQLFAMWTARAPEQVVRYVETYMAAHGEEMWHRAGREIERAYARHGSPLARMTALAPAPQVLHLFTDPDPEPLAAQQRFGREHPWFHPLPLERFRSHFPALEHPGRVAAEIARFLA